MGPRFRGDDEEGERLAVYTQVSAEALSDFLAKFDMGELVSAKGIAEGVENSNYLVDTTRSRFILTLAPLRRLDFTTWPGRWGPGGDEPAVLADPAAIVAPLRGAFPEAAIRVERLWDYPGLGTPSDAAVVNFVKGLTGANGTIKVAFGTEGGLFDQRLGIPTVICGPGSMAQGHKPDEFVTVEQLELCRAMLGALIDRLERGF